jgi:hypothetical protein
MQIQLNPVNNKTEKYYGFSVRKVKIPPKSMQRIQLSQMLEPTNDKDEIWIASPSEENEYKDLACEEQTINYEKGKAYIWVTNTHDNDTITLKNCAYVVEIQLTSETSIILYLITNFSKNLT